MVEGLYGDTDRTLSYARRQEALQSSRTDEVTTLRSPAARSADAPSIVADQWLGASDVSVTLANLHDGEKGRALDKTRDAYAGPYEVEHQSVQAPVMFKLAKPYASQKNVRELAGLVGPKLAERVQSGQADPAEIVRATQILINKGKLPAEPAGDLPGRIKAMQWQYGIGIDCACFTRHAAARAAGRASLPVGNDLGMRALDQNAHFAKVKAKDVRPGDIITLDAKPPETIGHNVVVRGNEPISAFEARERAKNSPELNGFFVGIGPFHEITVDSSWGAGENGSLRGGYRRETWLYDDSTKRWAHLDPTTNTWKVASRAPTDFDTYHGAYRVKS